MLMCKMEKIKNYIDMPAGRDYNKTVDLNVRNVSCFHALRKRLEAWQEGPRFPK